MRNRFSVLFDLNLCSGFLPELFYSFALDELKFPLENAGFRKWFDAFCNLQMVNQSAPSIAGFSDGFFKELQRTVSDNRSGQLFRSRKYKNVQDEKTADSLKNDIKTDRKPIRKTVRRKKALNRS